MKFLEEYTNLVIVGLWNKHIFNPEWESKFLFPKQELEIEFPIQHDASVRISSKDLRILIEGLRLCIICRKQEDSCFTSAKELAILIADYLPHTPITAIGVNFSFIQTPSEPLLQQLLVADNELITKHYGKIALTQITRNLIVKEIAMQVKITIHDDRIEFSTNFNFPVESLLQAKERLLSNDILDLKMETLKYLSTIHNLNIEA
jgi:hypothetical protein